MTLRDEGRYAVDLKGFTLSGIYRIQSGAVENAYVGGIDLNGDGNFNNDRPVYSKLSAPENSVAIRNGLIPCDPLITSIYVTSDCVPVNLADALRGGPKYSD